MQRVAQSAHLAGISTSAWWGAAIDRARKTKSLVNREAVWQVAQAVAGANGFRFRIERGAAPLDAALPSAEGPPRTAALSVRLARADFEWLDRQAKSLGLSKPMALTVAALRLLEEATGHADWLTRSALENYAAHGRKAVRKGVLFDLETPDLDGVTGQVAVSMLTLARPKVRPPPVWLRSAVERNQGSHCVVCGLVTDNLMLDRVVPAAHGSTSMEENWFLTCLTCHRHRQHRDLLMLTVIGPNAAERRSALLERRTRIMHYALNHLPTGSKKSVTDRFAHPRRRLWAWEDQAEGSFLGWTGVDGWSGDRADFLEATLRYGLRAAWVAVPGEPLTRLFRIEEPDDGRFRELLWTLIDENTLVRRLPMGRSGLVGKPVESGKDWGLLKAARPPAALKARRKG
ncbi:HNH endonuclease [Pseudomarimonas arenosa]|uniref:HNH endonuclease n=1 Tax=Pseudomarimonas arenosa TaxID=2774145 RepID=A0AAW3ZC91_9GAMM|nr:HNH endonuclease [Pseudomarimonas arenosa]MBD8524115.1 hypothetical protein [Pseudomarimonas arenosa]